ncbi:hypothetical protein [Shewanella frigidimarina]|uniref:hypothetical protein n=1 Tax=Shewanella frigidimarina TaxID=56812 RepID=UPI003D7A6DF6
MTLHSSGAISFAQVRTELKLSGSISLGQANVRKLLKKTSGPISLRDAYGKSNLLFHAYTYGEYQTGYERWSGFYPAKSMGSLSPITMDGTAATISYFRYIDDQRGMYFAMELVFNGATPFKYIDVFDQNGSLFTTLISPGGVGASFSYEEEEPDAEGHLSFVRQNRNIAFRGR